MEALSTWQNCLVYIILYVYMKYGHKNFRQKRKWLLLAYKVWSSLLHEDDLVNVNNILLDFAFRWDLCYWTSLTFRNGNFIGIVGKYFNAFFPPSSACLSASLVDHLNRCGVCISARLHRSIDLPLRTSPDSQIFLPPGKIRYSMNLYFPLDISLKYFHSSLKPISVNHLLFHQKFTVRV